MFAFALSRGAGLPFACFFYCFGVAIGLFGLLLGVSAFFGFATTGCLAGSILVFLILAFGVFAYLAGPLLSADFFGGAAASAGFFAGACLVLNCSVSFFTSFFTSFFYSTFCNFVASGFGLASCLGCFACSCF